MSLTLCGLRNCDTCRKARKWLDAAGIEYDFVDYRSEPVPAAVLRQWARGAGGWENLVNKRSATWRQLPDSQKAAATDGQWLRLVGEHPTLVRRPVVALADGTVSVGFSASRFEDLFGAR